MVSVNQVIAAMRQMIQYELGRGEEQELPPFGNMIEFAENYRTIDNRPFSFQDRDYLRYMYLDESKDIYIAKGRKLEITEFAANYSLYNLLKYPNTVGLYVSNTQDHVTIFARDRMHPAVNLSDSLRSLLAPGANESYIPFTNGSKLYMKSGWNDFVQTRSLTVDFLVIDEAQELDLSKIPIAQETLSKSKFGRTVVIGTGSEYGDPWWRLWHSGDCMEWDKQEQMWIAKNPLSKIRSYHLSQDIAKWIKPEDIEEKRRRAIPRLFTTEVIGWWYKSARKPLHEDEIRKLFDKRIDFIPSEKVDHSNPVFMGVDWGGGKQAFTVPWIWQLTNPVAPRFQLLYTAKITERSTETQADMISNLIDKYKVDRVVIDEGGGARQVEKLTKKYDDLVYKCHYGYNPGKPYEVISSERRLNIDRTWIIETIVDLITRHEKIENLSHLIPRIQIPAKDMEKVDWLVEQFTCIEAETVNPVGRSYVRYTHPEESNDDALHACCYAYLAWMLDEGEEWYMFSF